MPRPWVDNLSRSSFVDKFKIVLTPAIVLDEKVRRPHFMANRPKGKEIFYYQGRNINLMAAPEQSQWIQRSLGFVLCGSNRVHPTVVEFFQFQSKRGADWPTLPEQHCSQGSWKSTATSNILLSHHSSMAPFDRLIAGHQVPQSHIT